MYNEINLEKIEINSDPPAKEPDRQYYFIAKCREWVREFERENGEPFAFQESLPYDLEAQIIDIEDIDFGIWYVDAMDHPENYEGKTVRFKGMVYKNRNLGSEYFLPGRKVMTCCADDVAFLGYLCHTKNLEKLKKGQWLMVTAQVRYEERREYSGRSGPVLYTKALKSAEPPKTEMVSF